MKLVDKVSSLAHEDMYTLKDFDFAVDKKLAEELQKFWNESDAKAAKEVAKAADATDDYDEKVIVATAKYNDKREELQIV